MPWKEVLPMEEKNKFVVWAESGRFEFKALCARFGISRRVGYKWLGRYREHGMAGLQELSRAPRRVPGRTAPEIEALIVSERRRHPTWGPKKLRVVLARREQTERLPALSTIGEILQRHGLIEARRRRPSAFKVKREELREVERLNQVWAMDFKGWFYLQDGQRCDPLTVSDLQSRYLVGIEAVPQATQYWTRRSCEKLFAEYGLPECIRVDNGSPFGTIGAGGLSKLSVWWLTLGIDVEYIRPGHPQDNGRHERMHRTMKAECCDPPSTHREAQQRRFHRWRQEFNHERPHESLDQRPPAEVYQASARKYEVATTTDLYEPNTPSLRVNETGQVFWQGRDWLVGEAFAGQNVALEPNPEPAAQAHTRLIRFANVPLGILGDVAYGRLRPTVSAAPKPRKSCPSTNKN